MIEAWHFVCDDRKLRDGTPLEIGKRLVHDGPLVLCQSGYHASEKILDALQYAPGSVACRVQCDGDILRDTDKLVCRERTAIWALDATAVLRAFTRRCALDVIHLWDAPQVVRDYLTTGDESLRAAARAAAWAAARDAARADARDAASAAASADAWARYELWLVEMVTEAHTKEAT